MISDKHNSEDKKEEDRLKVKCEDLIDPETWAKLMKLIKEAPEATESGGSDPDPIF